MPRRDPKYRRHKRKGRADQAFVELEGRRVYLGIFGSAESRERYHRLLAEWNANHHHLPVSPKETAVVELIDRYWTHAQAYYLKPDGTPTGEVDNIRHAVRPLRAIYGRSRVAEFTPIRLKAIRNRLIDAGLARKTVNERIGIIKRVFRWGLAEGLVHSTVYEAIRAVPGLRRGRSGAREPERIKPVPQAHIDALEGRVSGQVWALIQLQLLTAGRSGELVTMRPCDLDQCGKVWLYRPPQHKTAHHGHERAIFLGPKAQQVLRPFLAGRAPWAAVFSPQEAEEERRKVLHERRVTPLSCGNRPGTNVKRKPEKTPGECYTTASYRRAIQRACDLANVPRWHPHQLRHNAATFLRKEFGLDTARIILGHTTPRVTDLYAELDAEKAIKAITEIG